MEKAVPLRFTLATPTVALALASSIATVTFVPREPVQAYGVAYAAGAGAVMPGAYVPAVSLRVKANAASVVLIATAPDVGFIITRTHAYAARKEGNNLYLFVYATVLGAIRPALI